MHDLRNDQWHDRFGENSITEDDVAQTLSLLLPQTFIHGEKLEISATKDKRDTMNLIRSPLLLKEAVNHQSTNASSLSSTVILDAFS